MVFLNPREENLEFDDVVSSGAFAELLTGQIGYPSRDVGSFQLGERFDRRVVIIQVANEAVDHCSRVDNGPGPQRSGDFFEIPVSSISQLHCLARHRLSFLNASL